MDGGRVLGIVLISQVKDGGTNRENEVDDIRVKRCKPGKMMGDRLHKAM